MNHRIDILRNNFLRYGVVIILVLLPFHAFLSVWLSSFLGNYTAIRLWKEVLLLFLITLTLFAVLQNRKLLNNLKLNKLLKFLVLSIATYVILFVVYGIYSLANGDIKTMAIGYSLISATRSLLFFVVCVVVGLVHKDWLKRHIYKILLIPASVVVFLGLLQSFVLPVDFLKNFGYGNETIKPYIAVDQKDEFARTQSTLRGPNPLGAYLVIVIAALVAVLLITRKLKWQAIVLLLATVLVLYTTYSRSAYIGAALALVLIAYLATQSARVKKIVVIACAFLVLISGLGLYALRDNDTVQNVVFHTDENSESQSSSNEHRAGALQSATQDVIKEPIGGGPGSAGPASVYNGEAVISENYFLQIGQEVGLLGLGLFLTICGLIVMLLWRIRDTSPLGIALLASFGGLVFVNLVSHAWADDTLAYIWWGFAGLIVGMYGIKDGKEKNNS